MMMRLLRSPVAAVLACSAVLLLGVAALLGSAATDSARASHAGGMDAMSIDMDPGGSPANTATSLGSIEFCARINENNTLDADEDAVDEVTVDITAEGVPPYSDNGTPSDPVDDYGGIIGYQFVVRYDESLLTILTENAEQLIGALPQSSVLDVSDPVPDTDRSNAWLGSALDIEPGPHESGSGVLHRISVSSDDNVSTPTYLSLDPLDTAHLDATGNAFLPDLAGFSAIALGQACSEVPVPATPPTPPGPTPSLSPPPQRVADLKITAFDAEIPTSVGVDEQFNIGVSLSVHNNGPDDAPDVATSVGYGAPFDCDVTSLPSRSESFAVSVTTTRTEQWTLKCRSPGVHTIVVSASAGHPFWSNTSDPNEDNNSTMSYFNLDVVSPEGEPSATPTSSPASGDPQAPGEPQPDPSGGMDAMSIDVDPSAAPANTATSIGSIEQCARINENDVLDGDEDAEDAVELDITAEGIPAFSDNGTPDNPTDDYGGIIAFQYELDYDEDRLTIVSEDARLLLSASAGSSVLDISDAVPDVNGSGSWLGGALDTSGPYEIAPEDGSGVLQRLTVSTDQAAAAGQGVFALREDSSVHLDAWNTALFPASFGFANIAVNQACGVLVTPAPPPGPTCCPPATPGTPTPIPAPTAEPTPVGPPPENDTPAGAVLISDLPYQQGQSTSGATGDESEPGASCLVLTSSVWYRFTPAVDTLLRADTVGSDFHTQIVVYRGSDVNQLTEVICVPADDQFNALAVFSAEAGETYYIAIDGYSSARGDLVFKLDVPPASACYPQIPNDCSMDALSIDTDPSAAPANTATSIGSIEQCARINENGFLDGDEDAEDTVEVDITAEGIPFDNRGTPDDSLDDVGGIIAFQYSLGYDEDRFTIVSANPDLLLNANPGSSVLDVSDPVPGTDGVWVGGALDISGGVPEEGSGVLQRLTVSTDETASAGQAAFALLEGESVHLDAWNTAHLPEAFGFANIAVNQGCGALVTPAPTQSPSPTPPPTPTPVPTPPSTPVGTAVPPTPTPTPCCQPPGPTPTCCAPPAPTPTCCSPQNPSTPIPGPAPVFLPGGALCFEDFASPAECDGDPSPGAASDIRTKFCLGEGPDCSVEGGSRDASVDGLVFFTPPSFVLVPGLPIGAIGGRFEETFKLGLLNGPCDKPTGVRFTLLNASTDVNNTISPKPAGQSNLMEPLAADGDGNGLPDGIDRYPVFLRNAFDPDWNAGPDGVPNTEDDVQGQGEPVSPIVRLGGFTKIEGHWFSVQLLTFAPGTRLPFAGDSVHFRQEFGYPTFVVFQDPTAPDSPLPISDICSPFDYNFVTFGRAWDNPCTGGPDTAETRGNCPDEFDVALGSSGYPLFPCDPNNSVDEDGDGVVNDGCTQVNAVPETGAECTNGTSDDGEDSTVNDGCPQIGDVPESHPGGTCSALNEGGCHFRFNPAAEGPQDFVTVAASARDADGDGWDNVLDTCALEPNPEWSPSSPDPVNDPDNDGLPNECDPDPNAPSPQSPLTGEDACFETGIVGPDEDGDCYSNRQDNCPTVANRLQQDADGDAIGDGCDPNPQTPDGGRAVLCMIFTVQVAPGASQSAGPPAISPDPNCYLAQVVDEAPEPEPCRAVAAVCGPGDATATPQPPDAGTGEATPTPTSTVLGDTQSPQPTTGGAGGPTGATVTPTATVLAAAALPSAGGGEGGSSWEIVAASIAAAIGVLGGGVFVRRRLVRAVVRRD